MSVPRWRIDAAFHLAPITWIKAKPCTKVPERKTPGNSQCFDVFGKHKWIDVFCCWVLATRAIHSLMLTSKSEKGFGWRDCV